MKEQDSACFGTPSRPDPRSCSVLKRAHRSLRRTRLDPIPITAYIRSLGFSIFTRALL
uniref:Uncharacterized protein n=1 Tax=Helianthus annuus TaxID=4232 RepID=A0A251RSG1_HELAN